MPQPVRTSAELSAAEARVATVPWQALAGLGPTLAPALDDMLSGQSAERCLDRLLRGNRHLNNPQRQVCAEAMFGVGLWRRRLRAEISTSSPTGLELLGALASGLGRTDDAWSLLGLAEHSLRPAPLDWPTRFSIPAEWEPFLSPELAAALNGPAAPCLRVNVARATRDALQPSLSAEGIATTLTSLSPWGLHVTQRANLFGASAWRDGLFEVQDEGSQLVAQLLGPVDGASVLDLCAGAGGKSLHLAALGARVTATDIDAKRLERCLVRAERARATIHVVFDQPTGLFDAVLVDAPCSELGTWRRSPDLRWRTGASDWAQLEATQRQLLHQGALFTRLGGRLVYVTCTLRPQENERVAEDFLHSHPQFARLASPWPADTLLPHVHGTDGFFGAVFERQL